MKEDLQILVATVFCPVCRKRITLLDAQEYKPGEQPKPYPWPEPITFVCCTSELQRVNPEDVEYRPLTIRAA
jgi:hypothetical protein